MSVFPAALLAQGRVTGTVFDSLRTGAPLAGATVTLEGVAATALTDALGRFAIADVPAGRYVATFFHPWLDSIRTAAPAVMVEVRAQETTQLRLATPSWATMSAYLCRVPQDSATSVVIGRARAAEDGRPLEGATARVEWFEISIEMMSGLQRGRRALTAKSDASGEFLLCGVPNDIEIEMRVSVGEQTTGPVELALANEPVAWREFAVSLTDPAARFSTSDASVTADAPGTARVRVLVKDETGRPVPGAIVGVRGSPVSGTTNAEGRVFLPAAPAGSQTLAVRAIGVVPVTKALEFAPARETTVEVRLDKGAVELAAVTVHGVRPSPEVAAFERRKRSGAGYFLDGDDLRRNGSNALLSSIPGVVMRQSPLGGNAMPMFRKSGGELCRPDVLVDGMPRVYMDAWELATLMQQAVRVEVYTRRLLVPGDLMVLGDCGAIGIWSR